MARGPGCVPTCVLDPERSTRMLCTEPGLEMKFNEDHARFMDAYREARSTGLSIPDAEAEARRIIAEEAE